MEGLATVLDLITKLVWRFRIRSQMISTHHNVEFVLKWRNKKMFIDQELKRITKKSRNTFTYVGRICYARINDDIRIRLEFCPGKYNGLTMTILNWNTGTIDSTKILFVDVWGVKKGAFKGNVVEPSIFCSNDKKWSWFGDVPSQSECDKLAEIIDQYISVYQNTKEAKKDNLEDLKAI